MDALGKLPGGFSCVLGGSFKLRETSGAKGRGTIRNNAVCMSTGGTKVPHEDIRGLTSRHPPGEQKHDLHDAPDVYHGCATIALSSLTVGEFDLTTNCGQVGVFVFKRAKVIAALLPLKPITAQMTSITETRGGVSSVFRTCPMRANGLPSNAAS